MAPLVPLEISEMIVDCLADEQEVLSVCSLVCRDWMPRSHRHLWRRVTLDCSRKRFAVFEDLMARSSTLSSNVQYFKLRYRARDGDLTAEPKPRNILPLLRCFSNLQELVLIRLSLDEMPEVEDLCPKLERLSMKFVTFASANDFHRFQRCFIGLQELIVKHVVWYPQDVSEDTAGIARSSLHLRRLEVTFEHDMWAFNSWLALLQSVHVAVFRVAGMPQETEHKEMALAFQEAWKACISSTETLELDMKKIECNDFGLGPILICLPDQPEALVLDDAAALRAVEVVSEAWDLPFDVSMAMYHMLPYLPGDVRLHSWLIVIQDCNEHTAMYWKRDWGDVFTPNRISHRPRFPCDVLVIRLLHPDRWNSYLYEALYPILRSAEVPVRLE